MPGYTKDILASYVPALVYTMYDGYYIYSPYTNTLSKDDYKTPEEDNGKGSTYQNGEKITGLKPYIYYSCRYKKGDDDFVITYALDNYITIQGRINNAEVFDYGYLINDCSGNGEDTATYRGVNIGPEELKEYIGGTEYVYTKINGVKYYKDKDGSWFSILNGTKYKQRNMKQANNAAVKYYSEAAAFKERLKKYRLDELSTKDAVDEKGEKLNLEKLGWRRL